MFLFVLIRHSVRLVLCTIFLYRSTIFTFYISFLKISCLVDFSSSHIQCGVLKYLISCKALASFAFFPSIFNFCHLFRPFCLYSFFRFGLIHSLHYLPTVPLPVLSSISTVTFLSLSSTALPSQLLPSHSLYSLHHTLRITAY